jgi:curved DNA-binding protein CbpA
LDRSLSGTLVVQEASGARHAMYMQNGNPAKIRTAALVSPLGEVIASMGIVEARLIEPLLSNSPNQAPLGQRMLQQGLIDSMNLELALREQMMRKAVFISSLPPSSVFGFFPEENLIQSWGLPELVLVDGLALVWPCVVANARDPRIDETIQRYGALPASLRPEADFRRLHIQDRVQGAIDLLRVKPMSFMELTRAGIADASKLRLFFYTMVITRCLDLGNANAKPPVGVQPVPARAPLPSNSPVISTISPEPPASEAFAARMGRRPRSNTNNPQEKSVAQKIPVHTPSIMPPGEFESRRDQILERARTIDGEDYFSILGVDKNASVDVLQAAYFALAKRWHPDRLNQDLLPYREQVSKVFARMSEAFQTLSDQERRAQYMNLLKGGTGTPEEQEKIARILEASVDFQKAEVYLKKNDIANAHKYASQALKYNPEQPDYQALAAWLDSQQPNVSSSDLLKIIQVFDKILLANPEHRRSCWYRGNLLKRAGQESKAMKDFKHLLELDPHHLDAAREIRLYEMRKARGTTTPFSEKEEPTDRRQTINSLFAKIFKK